MQEDINVTGQIEGFGRVAHRSAKMDKCENGFIVKYKTVKETKSNKSLYGDFNTVDATRVFILLSDALEFLAEYFSVEVN